MQPKVRAWVVFGGTTKLGSGRAHLLRLIQREGSLKRAVEAVGMSYRAAWGYIRELEEAAGFPLVERVGKGPSGGTRLTPEGVRFLEAFETFRDEVDAAAGRAYRSAFASFPGSGDAPAARGPRPRGHRHRGRA